jgi:hypothetical protein
LFAETANLLALRAVLTLAQKEGIVAREIHELMMADDAFSVVTEHGGIAFVSHATALKTSIDGVVFKAFGDKSLRFETCVVTRAEENLRFVDQFAKTRAMRRASSGTRAAGQGFTRSRYSYRSAAIGSNWDAFREG